MLARVHRCGCGKDWQNARRGPGLMFLVLEPDRETLVVTTIDLDFAMQQEPRAGRIITQGDEELYFADSGCWWRWENDDG